MAAAGKWKLYDLAKKALLDGTLDLDTNTLKVTLHSSASNANTLSQANLAFSNITNELATGNGYTNGGQAIASVTLTNSSGTITFDCADPVWTVTGSNLVARFAVIRAVGTLNGIVDPIIAVSLLDTAPADVTTTPGNTFTIQINASGVLQFSGATTD